jgi:hypothetical protein
VASAPNWLWVADPTYVSTWTGLIYVVFVVDAFSRQIVASGGVPLAACGAGARRAGNGDLVGPLRRPS